MDVLEVDLAPDDLGCPDAEQQRPSADDAEPQHSIESPDGWQPDVLQEVVIGQTVETFRRKPVHRSDREDQQQDVVGADGSGA